MIQIVYVITSLIYNCLVLLQIMMFLRAILSWMPLDEDNAIVVFLDTVTEPLIFPVRALLERSETVRNLPFDISFFVTFFLLSLLTMFLPTVG